MKYNVGDKVKIRNDLVTKETYNNLCMFKSMKEELLGKCATIESYTDNGNYVIKESGFIVSDEMIECKMGKEEENKNTLDKIDFNNLKVNDVIICGSKENYDYVVDKLYELGYDFGFKDRYFPYKVYEENVYIAINEDKDISYSNTHFLYGGRYEELRNIKLSDITIYDLRDKDAEKLNSKQESNSKISILNNVDNLDFDNKMLIDKHINMIFNKMFNSKHLREQYIDDLELIERLLDIKERL